MKKDQKNSIDRGALLERVAKASGIKVEVLVKRMNYKSRNTYYDHTKRKDLSLAILVRYGRVLKYDFSADIEEMDGLKVHEAEPSYLKAPLNIEDAISQRDFYHKSYMELLERVRELEKEIAGLRDEKVVGRKK